VDVELFCDFPKEAYVNSKIADIEKTIVKRTGSLRIQPGANISYRAVPSDKTGKDYADANGTMDLLKVAHIDTCAGSGSITPSTNVSQVYGNIKALVDRFEIFSKCTRSYVPHTDLRKDDVIAVSTLLAFGHYTLSYEDVARYDEEEDGDHKTLSVVVSSRKLNVIEGNYDITLKLRTNYVELSYTKRQNLAEDILASQCDRNCYEVATQQSVDNTMLKLAYAGLYGHEAISPDNTGCWVEPSSCFGYSIKKIGDVCTDNEECKTECCHGDYWFWGTKKCAEASSCS